MFAWYGMVVSGVIYYALNIISDIKSNGGLHR